MRPGENPVAVTFSGADGRLDAADTRRRLKAIFIGSVGILVEWYDF
jgi:MHS family alpha-ketoglutarate permease-like MFS transporter